MTSTSDRAVADARATVDLLAVLPLFAGVAEGELETLARVTRLVEAAAGTVLWREGDEADGLHVVVSGTLKIETRLPGERSVEIATAGPGEVLGEIPLLGGGPRWATVRAVDDCSLLFLGRAEFGGLVSGASSGALAVRRRILALVCERLRGRHETLAEWLGGGDARVDPPAAPATVGGGALPPDQYLRALPFFRSLDRTTTAEMLRRSIVTELPRGEVLVAERGPAPGFWITLNGAVEELIRRGDEVIRVNLAGPGHAFGYVGLIDGLPSSVSAATRERSILMFLPPEDFDALFDPTLGPTAFRDAIQRELVHALRAAWRPRARLAAGRPRAR
jgi:CRP/FNR family transcriptional regulator, cyclic AMP receptor protein